MASAKVRDYAKLASDIKDAVGETNIISATHCATRLRLVLKESPSAAVTQQVSSMPSVIQVVEKGGQYQIVIGTHAKDVYEELTRIMHLDASAQAEIKQSIPQRVIATMSAVFAPFVYILAAAGLVQGALIIITGLAPAFAETGTYEVLSFVSWTPFTFLPVLIAVTASKHFKCNTFIAMWCCLALVNGSWAEIAARIAGGEVVKFLAFPMAQTTYTSTVLPPLFLVLVLSLLEHFLDRHIPDVLKAIGVPFLCSIIMVPSTILVIGPLSDMLANAIAIGYNWLYQTAPVVAALIIGGLWQVIVIFGVHWGVTPMILADFQNFGCDSFQAFQTCAVVAQAAACLGVFIKTRDVKKKNVALSAGLTGIFGITEPAIYGVTLPLKKPFIAGCIGGAVGAVIVAFTGAMYYVYAGLPGLLTIVNVIDTSGVNTFSLYGELIGMAATILVTVVLIQIMGCDPKPAAETVEEVPIRQAPAVPVAQPASITIYAPLNGEIKLCSQVNDPTFAEGILGQGAAIVPTEGKLYAPFDCTVDSLFDTHHAINLAGDGVEMLIHIGLETVTLNGKGFTPHVKDGDKVKAGDLLIEFDLDFLKKNFDTITPILVTNVEDFTAVEQIKEAGTVKVGDPILTVKR